MAETPLLINEPGGNSTVGKSPGRWRWQVSLRTAFLLMAAIAVWMAYFVNRRHNALVQSRIDVLVPLAHELVIDDATKIAVVKMEEHWFGENIWEIYLPEGDYRLKVATRGIDDNSFPDSAKNAPIRAGRHVVAVEQRRQATGWQVSVLVDGTELLAVDETNDWAANTGSTSSGQGSPSAQLPPEKPVVLLRTCFMRMNATKPSATSEEVRDGVLLWIERTGAPSTKR